MGKLSDFQHIYCLFCRTGAEDRLCEEIRARFPTIHPLAGKQEKHRTVNKHYEIDRRTFLPCYLFLYSEENIDFESLLRMDDIYRFLSDEATAHELQNSDRAFAEWLLQNEGLIGISRITNQDSKIEIRSGPMKYFSTKIIRLDKHTKNALVRMDFLGTEREIWLAFEFDDDTTNKNGEE